MKKLFMLLVFLFILYFGIQVGFRLFEKEHFSEYKIVDGENDFYITEQYYKGNNKSNGIYDITIKIKDSSFTLQTSHNFEKKSGIISNLKYYNSGTRECLYVIFSGNRVLSDVMCKTESGIRYFHDIPNPEEELKQFVSNLNYYNQNQWSEQKNDPVGEYPLTVYPYNMIKNTYVGIETPKGMITVNDINLKKYANISMFQKENYARPISALVDQYYFTADYSETKNFYTFQLMNLVNNEVKTIVYQTPLSFNSYIQGVINHSVYLFDRDSRKQYEINIKKRTINEIGNSVDGIKYYDSGEWKTLDANEAYQTNLLFKMESNNDYSNMSYTKIDKVGNEQSGMYYLYKKVGDKTQVYRSSIKKPEEVTFLFETTNISNVQYIDDYIYYIDGDLLKYYNVETGVRTLLEYEDFNFNQNLYYYVYIKK